MKNISPRVRYVPGFREARGDVKVLVAREQVIEKKRVDTLRVGVKADTRIKVRRTRLYDHDQGVGIRAAGAGGKITTSDSPRSNRRQTRILRATAGETD